MSSMIRVNKLNRMLRYEIYIYLSRYPTVFLPIMRWKKGSIVVNKKTDIVIDGFPRSGNTFAVAAFSLAQNREVNIARHTHAPAQILWAISKKPIIVLIRKPRDAILSFLIREPLLSPQQVIRSFIAFYGSLMDYRERIVIARFDEVISDFGAIIEQVNQKFDTSFKTFHHTESNVKECFEQIEQMDRADTGKDIVSETTVARPSKERDMKKQELYNTFNNSDIHDLLKLAENMYIEFLSTNSSI